MWQEVERHQAEANEEQRKLLKLDRDAVEMHSRLNTAQNNLRAAYEKRDDLRRSRDRLEPNVRKLEKKVTSATLKNRPPVASQNDWQSVKFADQYKTRCTSYIKISVDSPWTACKLHSDGDETSGSNVMVASGYDNSQSWRCFVILYPATTDIFCMPWLSLCNNAVLSQGLWMINSFRIKTVQAAENIWVSQQSGAELRCLILCWLTQGVCPRAKN